MTWACAKLDRCECIAPGDHCTSAYQIPTRSPSMDHDPRDVECAREAVRRRWPSLLWERDIHADAKDSYILAAKLARERAENPPVDPLLLVARKIVEAAFEGVGWLDYATEARRGDYDATPWMLDALAELKAVKRAGS